MNKLIITFLVGIFIFSSVLSVHAAEEIDAYCVVPTDSVPHGSTVSLTIKFSDSDKSNDFIAQGPFKILKYDKDGKPIIITFKRGNEKDKDGKDNPDKPTLTFPVVLTPKHKLPAPATESVTYTYYVTYKQGNRGKLFTTNREQPVDCSFVVQHDIEEKTTPTITGDPDFDLLRIKQKNIAPVTSSVPNITTTEKNKDIKQKAADQITRAEKAINQATDLLKRAKVALGNGKYNEAFYLARSAEIILGAKGNKTVPATGGIKSILQTQVKPIQPPVPPQAKPLLNNMLAPTTTAP